MPSEYVTVYVSRRAAETLERDLSEHHGAAQAVVLRAVRKALKTNAGAKRYPWQKEEAA